MRVSPKQALTYQGGEGMWSYVLHRVTGVGVFLFLLAHIADTAVIMVGPEAYNHVVSLFRHPVFRLGEVVLFGALVFHSLNGVRVAIVDLTVKGTVWQKQMFWAVMVLFFVIMIPSTYVMVSPIFLK